MSETELHRRCIKAVPQNVGALQRKGKLERNLQGENVSKALIKLKGPLTDADHAVEAVQRLVAPKRFVFRQKISKTAAEPTPEPYACACTCVDILGVVSRRAFIPLKLISSEVPPCPMMFEYCLKCLGFEGTKPAYPDFVQQLTFHHRLVPLA